MKNIILTTTISLSCLGFLASCHQGKPQPDAHTVDESISVVGATLRQVVFDDDIMFPSNLILLDDSLLIVQEPKNVEGFLSVFNTNTKQKIAQFASIGEAPDEFQNPRLLNDLSTFSTFCVGDSRRIVRYNATSISKGDFSGSEILSIPQEMRNYNTVVSLTDFLIVYNQTSECTLSLYHPQTKNVTQIPYFPTTVWTEGSQYVKAMEVFSSSMTSAGQNIAIAYRNWNIVSIITPEGEVIRQINFPEYDFNKGKMKIDPSDGNLTFDQDSKIFFTKIRSNQDYIFALGWSATKDLIRNGEATSYIYVIDWEGNIKQQIMFDRDVSTFCIDKDSIRYVVATGDDGELHVYEYTLPSQIN